MRVPVKVRMSKQEADEILDGALKRVMAEEKLTYQDAFLWMLKNKPDLVQAWSDVNRRVIHAKQMPGTLAEAEEQAKNG